MANRRVKLERKSKKLVAENDRPQAIDAAYLSTVKLWAKKTKIRLAQLAVL